MRFAPHTIAILLLLGSTLSAQKPTTAGERSSADAEREERFDAFTEMMKKTVMVGSFTVDGDEAQNRKPERYEISRVLKQEQGDYWSFFARIKYAKYDVTVPVPVELKWAGNTPVITVDNVTLPGLGTFDARVLISDNKYVGTWRHGEVGGLMFGHIEKQADEAERVEPDVQVDADAAPGSD
jgi:hypothetical protein